MHQITITQKGLDLNEMLNSMHAEQLHSIKAIQQNNMFQSTNYEFYSSLSKNENLPNQYRMSVFASSNSPINLIPIKGNSVYNNRSKYKSMVKNKTISDINKTTDDYINFSKKFNLLDTTKQNNFNSSLEKKDPSKQFNHSLYSNFSIKESPQQTSFQFNLREKYRYDQMNQLQCLKGDQYERINEKYHNQQVKFEKLMGQIAETQTTLEEHRSLPLLKDNQFWKDWQQYQQTINTVIKDQSREKERVYDRLISQNQLQYQHYHSKIHPNLIKTPSTSVMEIKL